MVFVFFFLNTMVFVSDVKELMSIDHFFIVTDLPVCGILYQFKPLTFMIYIMYYRKFRNVRLDLAGQNILKTFGQHWQDHQLFLEFRCSSKIRWH